MEEVNYYIGDRVKLIDDGVYYIIEEINDNVIVGKLDLEGFNFISILQEDTIELVRSYKDPLIDLPEIAVMHVALHAELLSDFDYITSQCEEKVKNDFPKYNPKLYFEDVEGELVSIYVRL